MTVSTHHLMTEEIRYIKEAKCVFSCWIGVPCEEDVDHNK